MTEPPARVVYEYLRELGVIGSSAGELPWLAGVGPMPQDGNEFVAIIDAGARQLGRIQRTGERVSKPRIQVLVRATDYPTGWAKGFEIQTVFDKVGVRTTTGGVGQIVPVAIGDQNWAIKLISVETPVMPLGREPDTGRNLFSINALVSLELITPENYSLIFPGVFG
jgi:hypothetical protein